MALFASLRKSSLHVIRIRGVLKVLQMARYARRVGDVVVAIDMAFRTLQCGVRAGKREACVVVVEGGVEPCCRSVALLTRGGESCLHVIRVGGRFVILDVAGSTVGRRAWVASVHVAESTSNTNVPAG